MEEIKHVTTKWAVEILMAVVALAAYLLRKVTKGHSDSVKVTYEQLALLVAEKAGRAEKAEKHNAILQEQIHRLEKEILFLKTAVNTNTVEADIREKVFESVSKDKPQAALNDLYYYAVGRDDEEMMQEVALIRSQLYGLGEKLRGNTISPEQARRNKNRINEAVLQLATEASENR